ncbi:hypothetical protein EDB85DRAFT_1287455 [Lactarius pseudohatsudake]|nr:hypothetical protein EDB85DRAFT_1287455 [Lactarius pseudohatsudake]
MEALSFLPILVQYHERCPRAVHQTSRIPHFDVRKVCDNTHLSLLIFPPSVPFFLQHAPMMICPTFPHLQCTPGPCQHKLWVTHAIPPSYQEVAEGEGKRTFREEHLFGAPCDVFSGTAVRPLPLSAPHADCLAVWRDGTYSYNVVDIHSLAPASQTTQPGRSNHFRFDDLLFSSTIHTPGSTYTRLARVCKPSQVLDH